MIKRHIFSYLPLFHTLLRVTRIQHPGSPVLCTPLERHKWRSHHRTPSPTLHYIKLLTGPRNASSSPPQDEAGLPGGWGLTGHCTAPTWTARWTRGSGHQVGTTWCRTKEVRRLIYRKTQNKHKTNNCYKQLYNTGDIFTFWLTFSTSEVSNYWRNVIRGCKQLQSAECGISEGIIIKSWFGHHIRLPETSH